MKKFAGYTNGIYLGTWLEQCFRKTGRCKSFVDRDNIAKIASAGVSYVQLPIDYHLILDDSGFTYIDNLAQWCGEFGVNLVIELCMPKAKEGKGGLTESIELQETFCKLWEEIAARYGRYNDRIAFEFPTITMDSVSSDIWGSITDKCISRVKTIAPDTIVFV